MKKDCNRYYLKYIRQVRRRWRMKLALRGALGVVGLGVVVLLLSAYGLESWRFTAGSIIAFHKYSDDLKAGDLGVICSFGAGYSAGNVIVRKLH